MGYQRLPNNISPEELLKALQEAEEGTSSLDSTTIFLTKHKIEPGTNRVNANLLHAIYKQETIGAVNRKEFKAIVRMYLSRAEGTEYYLANLPNSYFRELLIKEPRTRRKLHRIHIKNILRILLISME